MPAPTLSGPNVDRSLKVLDKHQAIWHSFLENDQKSGRIMQKSILALAATLSIMALSTGSAQSGQYPFGDPPYRLNWEYNPEIQNGCWKWNWQQYQWDDYCPVYVNPKAYMYPRAGRAVLRTRG
jgi:hypothetical protein